MLFHLFLQALLLLLIGGHKIFNVSIGLGPLNWARDGYWGWLFGIEQLLRLWAKNSVLGFRLDDRFSFLDLHFLGLLLDAYQLRWIWLAILLLYLYRKFRI